MVAISTASSGAKIRLVGLLLFVVLFLLPDRCVGQQKQPARAASDGGGEKDETAASPPVLLGDDPSLQQDNKWWDEAFAETFSDSSGETEIFSNLNADGELSDAIESTWLEASDHRILVKKTITIKVYWTILMSKSKDIGDWSNSLIQESMMKVKEKFASSPFNFKLERIKRVKNDKWFACKQQSVFKRRFRKPGRNSLNIYMCNWRKKEGGSFGSATYAFDIQQNPAIIDGAIIANPTVKNEGKAKKAVDAHMTVVHEIGHWLGLYHTWENGCKGKGDMVADTAPHLKDTLDNDDAENCFGNGTAFYLSPCKGHLKEKLPILNIMNYVKSECLDWFGSFTPGQVRFRKAKKY